MLHSLPQAVWHQEKESNEKLATAYRRIRLCVALIRARAASRKQIVFTRILAGSLVDYILKNGRNK